MTETDDDQEFTRTLNPKNLFKVLSFSDSVLAPSGIFLRDREAEQEKYTSKMEYFLTCAIILSRIAFGLFLSIHATTLIALADQVHSSIGDVSWLFAAKSLGAMIGGLATLPLMRRIDNMLAFSVSSFLLGGSLVVTPLAPTYRRLIIYVSLGGAGYGYLTVGTQSMITQLLKLQNFTKLISGYHFLIAIGAVLAPFLATPFLEGKRENEICFFKNDQENKSLIVEPVDHTPVASETNPAILWCYLICGIVIFLAALTFLFLKITKVELILRQKRNILEEKVEDGLDKLTLLSLYLCIYYFFCVAGETSYHAFIYSVSICSNLTFQPQFGALLLSLYWAGYGIGGIGGAKILNRFPNQTTGLCLFSEVLFLTIMCMYGEFNAALTWIVTFLCGFFHSVLYQAGSLWASRHLKVAENYVIIFSISQALGTMAIVPFSGYLFDTVPFYVMFVALGCSISSAIAFVFMTIEGRRNIKKKYKTEESPINRQ